MLYTIIAVFAFAAVLGFVVLVKLTSGKETPKPVVFAHGAFAATGLVLLILYAIRNPDASPTLSLILFVVAALGGFYLFYNDYFRKKPGPYGLAILHGLLAVGAFVTLLVFAFS